jgi:hypothetical protein
MKRTSREGAESLRLIDESLGIHLSRPLTRILTQEFPALAAGLQSVLGGSVFAALGVVAFEFGEKLTKSIEKAMHAQEEFRAATAKVGTTLETIADSWAVKIAALNSKGTFAEIISKGAEEARRQFQELSKAIDEAQQKAAAANQPLTKIESGIGNLWKRLTEGATEGVANHQKFELKELSDGIDQAFRADKLNGTHTALALIERDLERVNARLREYRALGEGAFTSPEIYKAQTDGLDQQVDLLEKTKVEIEGNREAWEKAAQAAKAHEQAIERMKEAAAALQSFYRDTSAGLGKIVPQTDPIKKLATEISELRIKAENDFADMERFGSSALSLKAAKVALAEYEHQLDGAFTKAKNAAAEAKELAALPTKISGTGTAPTFAAPALPQLGAGGAIGEQLDSFAADRGAQLKTIADAQEKGTPILQRYAAEWAKLDIAFKGITDPSLLAAKLSAQNNLVDQYSEAMVKAADKTYRLQEELQKLLERSDEASAGFKAFLKQLQINGSEEGKFIFQALTEASKGAEDVAARSLVTILETHRGQHQKLIHELRAMWEGYFASLTEMAVKHGLDKLLGQGAAAIQKVFGGGSKDDKDKSTLAAAAAKLTPEAMAKQVAIAGSTLTSAFAELTAAAHAAAAALSTSGASSAGGAAAGAGGGFEGLFAEGGDITPGGSFIAGEAGAEEIRLGAGGGAHVTPMGGKGGGDTHIYQDFTGSIVNEEVMTRAEYARASAFSEQRVMQATASMQREINLRKRPG